MLYKPTSPTPYAVSICESEKDYLAPEEAIFKCNILGGEIAKTRLTITDNHNQYWYYNGRVTPKITKGSYDTEIKYDLNTATGDLSTESLKFNKITISDKPERTDNLQVKLGDMLKKGTHTWQLRLYEKGSIKDLNGQDADSNYTGSIWLGYGAIGSTILGIGSFDDDGDYSDNVLYFSDLSQTCSPKQHDNFTRQCVAISVRPHMNIYKQFTTAFSSSDTGESYKRITNITKDDIKIDLRKLYNYYDNNARYYIKINDVVYPIIDYKYYKPNITTYDKTSTYIKNNVIDALENNINSYGEPNEAYVIIDYKDAFINKNSEGEVISLNINEGDTYEIYCNYIDSDEYYFDVVSKPSLILTDIIGKILIGDDASPFTLEYSNFNVTGHYMQSDGAIINYYKTVLEIYNDETKQYEVIDDTGYVYSSLLTYSYERFMNEKKYRMTITVCDTNNYIIEKCIILNTKYGNDTIPLNVTVSYNPDNDSNIIDFSDVISISAQETDNQLGYQLLAVNNEGTITNGEDTNICKINIGNKFTYNKIDGVGNLNFLNPVIYMEIRLTQNKYGLIARATDDVGTVYTLSWNGIKLLASWQYSNGSQINKTLTPYTNLHTSIDALKSENINFDNPYIWESNLVWDDTYYWHEETLLSEKWWRIIMTSENVYIKNIIDDGDYLQGVGES